MSRASRARKIAIAAAYGGGGLGLGLAGAFGVIRTEAYLARRTIGEPTEEAPRCDGRYGDDHTGDPLRMAMLGDSGAAGLGVEDGSQTPGATLAAGLAECADRPVDLVCVAKTGARSADLVGQVEQVLQHGRPDVTVIMIGANDVTHRVRPSTAVRHLDQAVRLLRESGSEVVVGTCPDLGTVEPVAQPLRYLARYWSRQLAAAQTIVVVEAGARSVSLGDILGPEFAASPAEMFGPDRFHPSVAGYASASAVLLPSVCAALGLWFGDVEELPDLSRGEGVRPVAWAAAEAVDEAGTEVAGAQVAGNDRGPRGRWALLRRRKGKPAEELAWQAAADPGGGVPETQA
jgi:lysophospholipase L1-like esterase